MSILSGIKKVIPYFKNADGNYEQLSYKTSSQTVDFDDGKTAETKLGAIKGITTSTSVTETGYAADAKTVSEINQSLVSFNVDNLINESSLFSPEIAYKMPEAEKGNFKSLDMILATVPLPEPAGPSIAITFPIKSHHINYNIY